MASDAETLAAVIQQMNDNPNWPVTDTHVQNNAFALQALDLIEQRIIRAKQAGMDTSALEQQIANIRAQALRFKRAYAPNT